MGLTAMGWVGGRGLEWWERGLGGTWGLGDLGDSRAAAHTFVWGLYLNRKHSTTDQQHLCRSTKAVQTYGPVTRATA